MTGEGLMSFCCFVTVSFWYQDSEEVLKEKFEQYMSNAWLTEQKLSCWVVEIVFGGTWIQRAEQVAECRLSAGDQGLVGSNSSFKLEGSLTVSLIDDMKFRGSSQSSHHWKTIITQHNTGQLIENHTQSNFLQIAILKFFLYISQ